MNKISIRSELAVHIMKCPFHQKTRLWGQRNFCSADIHAMNPENLASATRRSDGSVSYMKDLLHNYERPFINSCTKALNGP